MNQILITVLVASIVGSQFQISDAQSLSTIIKIQSCNDNQYVGVPPKVGPPTTPAPPTTEEATTATESSTTAIEESTTTGSPAATTAAPAPVVPIPGGGTTTIISWKVNWGNAVTNGTGSLITAVDTTTSENRCLGNSAGSITVTDSVSFPTAGKFIWNFISVFDSVSWTYKYKITNKANNRCLKKVKNGAFSLAACPSSNSIEFLYNILS